MKQKHEPYIELKASDTQCKVLTLFAVYGPGDEAMAWTDADNGWSIITPEGDVTVTCDESALVVRGPGGKAWEVPVTMP